MNHVFRAVLLLLFVTGPLFAGDTLLDLSETGGVDGAVVRITAGDWSRVIVIGASEERTLRVRGEDVRVEVLSGGGSLRIGSTEARRRRAVLPPQQQPDKPSSFGLIDGAEKSGAIDAETALLYRVYAEFADARLPAPYRGDDSRVTDSLYLSEVRDRFATLSPAAQAIVLPFLTPPAYKTSWANANDPAVSASATPPPCEFFADKWAFVDSTNGLVRIWYRTDLPDAQRAGDLAGRIDTTIWPKISSLMTGHVPVSDLGNDCNGGNGRLDVYLSEVPHSDTVAYKSCDRAPRAAFILLKRTSPDVLAAHEIFHAFQFSYPLAGCITDDNYRWWAEGSAQWSQDYVIPADKLEQAVAPAFLDVPELQLDFKDTTHEYGTYLLPFYQARKSGSATFVSASWANSATQPALEALDQALPGGFEAVWPEFVKYNWNQKPFDDYTKWDGLTAQAKPAGGVAANLSAAPDSATNLKLGLPRLSATYKDFLFDDSVRTIAFWNGVTTSLALRDRPLGGLQYESDPADGEQTKGAHITALLRFGQTWRTEDWTNRPFVTLCRDVTAERIDELVLIISNSEFKSRDRKLEAAGHVPVLFATNMGCWRWKGTARYSDGNGQSVDTIVTWTRADETQTTPSISYVAEGDESWRVSGGGCSGSGNAKVEGFSTLTTFNFITSEGTFRRSYSAAGSDTRLYPITCGNFSTSFGFNAWLLTPPQPFVPGIPGARLVLVSADGRVMDGSYKVDPSSPLEWTWHFESQRQ